MLAVFIQSQLLGGTGICHFLVVFAGLDEIQQMTFIQISSFGLLLNNKISLSVFKMHSISLVTEVNRSRNPLYFSFCTEHTWVNVGKFIEQLRILLSVLFFALIKEAATSVSGNTEDAICP